MTDTTLAEAPPRPRRTLTASPAMRARLGLVEVEAPPLEPALRENGGGAISPKPDRKAEVDPSPATGLAEEKAARLAEVRQVEALLRERWPVAFCVPRPPLAIGIHKQVLELETRGKLSQAVTVLGSRGPAADAYFLASDTIDPVVLGRFMHWWVRRTDYLDAVAHGEPRRNLDGSPAGEPDEPQRREAARQVYGARAEVVLARIAARRAAEREPAT